MADQKVSELTELAAGGLDPSADWLLVSDMSDLTSKKMKPSEMIRASLPYISTFWDFTTGSLLPTVSFTRASTAWRFNSSGVLVPETTNTPRFQYDPSSLVARGLLVEEAATNGIRNSMATGAVAGSPGTPATNWGWGGDVGLGISRTTVGSTTEDGIGATDINFSGTSTASGQLFVIYEATAIIAAVLGQTFTVSHFLRLVGGAETNIVILTGFFEMDSGGAILATQFTAGAQTVTSAALKTQRFSYTAAITNAACAYIRPFLRVTFASGVTLNGTYRIGLPQVVQSSAISSPIITTGGAAARAADTVVITNPQVLADQCYIVKARTPVSSSSTANIVFQVDDGTFNNRRAIYYFNGRLYATALVGGVAQATLDLGAVANDTDFVIAARFADNNFAASLNGGAIVTDTLGVNPIGLTTARIGAVGSSNSWNSTIRSLETRRTATDAELPLLAA